MTDIFEKFVAAIESKEDDLAEQLVQNLSKADESDLIELVGASDVDQRWWAVRALAHCGQGAAATVVAEALNAEEVEVRSVACMALAALHVRYPATVQPLLSNLGHCLADDAGFVRQSAVDSLAKCGDDALGTLADVLASSHEGARTRAAITLRKIASMGAASLLFRYLNDPNYLVHTYCNEALDEMGLLDNILVAV